MNEGQPQEYLFMLEVRGMKTVRVQLDSIDKIKVFNRVVCKFDCDFDLEQGRYYIDAKSMLGIMSLDLSSPLLLHFSASEEEEEKIMEALKDFLAD